MFAFATVGIMVFGEMSGRVAAVAKQPVFNLMRHRLGLKLGLVTLAASMISNLITCAAEIGGVALVLNYLTGAPYMVVAVAMTRRSDRFDLGPAVQVDRAHLRPARAVHDRLRARRSSPIHPPWQQIAGGFVPQIPKGLQHARSC